MKDRLLIGELSRQVGIPTQTIRYYERLGLLSSPQRTESQYRVYTGEAQERLQFIQKAKHFGLSLDEIKRLIDISAEGSRPCANLKTMVEQHIDDLDCRIQEMVEFRQELANRYAKIDTLLPQSSDRSSKICWLIEQETMSPK